MAAILKLRIKNGYNLKGQIEAMQPFDDGTQLSPMQGIRNGDMLVPNERCV
jgi:hypothetical protein